MYTYLVFLLIVSFPAFGYAIVHRRFLKGAYGYRLFPPFIWALALGFFLFEVIALNAGWWEIYPSKTMGIHLLGVPIEELLFFLFIPQITLLVWALSRKPGSGKRARHFAGHHPRQFMKWWRNR